MAHIHISDPGLAPGSVCAYIEDMLMELAVLAERTGEPVLAGFIRDAAAAATRSKAAGWRPLDSFTDDAT